MDEGVRQLRAALEGAEKLAEDVLVIKQRLIDNDKERNKAREAMAAMRRVQKKREEQEKQRQQRLSLRGQPQRAPTASPAPPTPRPATPREGSSSSLIEPQGTQVLETTASTGGGSGPGARSRELLEPSARSRSRGGDAAVPGSLRLGLQDSWVPLLGRAAASGQKDARGAGGTPLIEELPAPGLELRRPKGGSEAADGGAPCSLCGRGGDGGAQPSARLDPDPGPAGPEARKQQVWMAFPVSGPADGSRAPGFFFLAPQAAIQEQLKRDLAAMDSHADELRERQKASLQELSDKGGLDGQGGLVKALTTLKDKPDSGRLGQE